MLFADYSSDLGRWLAIVLVIWGGVVIFRWLSKTAGNALKDENNWKTAAGFIWRLFR